jgi:2-keto-4-pentenoate hydratase/2-oxohepta-3-ene-1,7-dioic acid hydratase in catechol pathway
MSQTYARFQTVEGPIWHRLVGEDWCPLTAAPWLPHSDKAPLERLELLAPVVPSKVIGIASNYRDHAREMGKPVPTLPKIFLKPPSSVIGPLAPIPIPPKTERVDHEAELGVVIGRRCSRVRQEESLSYVFGYTCVNDVTARDFQAADGVFARAKGFDGFCPVGPYLVTDIDPSALSVSCQVDAQLRQNGNTQDMVFSVAELIAFVSSVMTLEPGDLIATGTPAGVGPLQAGQRVIVAVEGLGRLENPVINRDDR